MKKMIVFAVAALFTVSSFANEPSAVNEKVLNSFKQTFSNAEKVKWYEADNSYSVRFYQSGMRYIVYYDKRGNITGSMKFYEPSMLPTQVLKEINRTYSHMKTCLVTEISAADQTAYFVKMEDDKYWYTVKFNIYGEDEIHEKVRKQ